MAEIKRVTLHPLYDDGTINKNVNIYPKTLIDGIVDREGNPVDIPALIDQEKERAESVEYELDNKINDEKTRAQTVEESLNTKIHQEVEERQLADIDLNNRIEYINTNYYNKSETDNLLLQKEDVQNKVNVISDESTDTEYPSAAAVKDYVYNTSGKRIDNILEGSTTFAGDKTFPDGIKVGKDGNPCISIYNYETDNYDSIYGGLDGSDFTCIHTNTFGAFELRTEKITNTWGADSGLLIPNTEEWADDKVIATVNDTEQHYFDKFVSHANITDQFNEGEIAYCSEGTYLRPGETPSTVSLKWEQTNNKAIYLKDIYIRYIDKNEEEQEYTYVFNQNQFKSLNEEVTLSDITWLIEDTNNISYFGYDANKGQQFGSSGLGARSLTLTTSSLSGCTIKEIIISTSGASGTVAKAYITAAGQNWLINEGETEESLFHNLTTVNTSVRFTYGEGTKIGEGHPVKVINKFITKQNGQIIETEPLENYLYCNRLNNNLYRLSENNLIEVSKSLELGTTSTTAYAGNLGNDTRDKTLNILNGKTQFSGEKTFTDQITFNSTITVGDDSYISIGKYDDGDVYSIYTLGLHTDYIGTNSDYLNEIYILDNLNLNRNKICDLHEPEKDTDAATKKYVDAVFSTSNLINGQEQGSLQQFGKFEENLTWSSNDKSIARVSFEGTVQAINEGSTIISVRDNNGRKAECIVNVSGTALKSDKRLLGAARSNDIWTKVTGTLTPGNYIIVSTTDDYCMTPKNQESSGQSTANTGSYTCDSWTTATDCASFSFEIAESGKFYIKDGACFVYASGTTNNGLGSRDDNSQNPDYGIWNISENELDPGTYSIINNNGRQISKYNTSNWRSYGSTSGSKTNVHLYKKNEIEPTQLDSPEINISDLIITWGEIENATGYHYSISNSDSASEVISNDTEALNINISSLQLNVGNYSAKVLAKGDGLNYIDSEYSNEVSFTISEPPVITGITISPKTVTGVSFGDTFQFSAEVIGTGSYSHNVNWTSDDENKATIDNTGLATIHSIPGNVNITATSDDPTIYDTALITVDRAECLYLDVSVINLKVGETYKLKCSDKEPSKAQGILSTALGIGSIATEDNQVVIGKYNKQTDSLFVVGNGENTDSRSNAFEIYEDGHAEVNLMGTTDKSVVTKEYVDSYTISVPRCPSTTDGIYVLQANVSNGVVTYNWVLDTSAHLE